MPMVYAEEETALSEDKVTVETPVVDEEPVVEEKSIEEADPKDQLVPETDNVIHQPYHQPVVKQQVTEEKPNPKTGFNLIFPITILLLTLSTTYILKRKQRN